MTKKILNITSLLMATTMLIACDIEGKDGNWDSIQITVNGQRQKSSTYDVPADGGEFKIYSKNYGELWLNRVMENEDTIVWPEDRDWTDYRNIHLTKEWYEIQYDESGNIVVNIQSKEPSASARAITFEVECGDAFGSIRLLQK